MFLLFIIFQNKIYSGGGETEHDNEESKSVSRRINVTSVVVIAKPKRFRFNKQEVNEFYSSLIRLNEINKRLISHIQNYKKKDYQPEFSVYSSASLEKFLDTIIQKRKNAEDFQTCEYEFVKFCELYYLILLHILKHESNLQLIFFQFSEEIILPILKTIRCKLIYYIFFYPYDLAEEKFFLFKRNDIDRCYSLRIFLHKFLESQNKNVPFDQIDKNLTVSDLLSLCSNMFVRFVMINRRNYEDFYRNLKPLKKLLSDQMIDFLLINGQINGLALDVRVKLRRFLLKNNLDLEKQFVEQNSIPFLSDMINKKASMLNLLPISYENDISLQ